MKKTLTILLSIIGSLLLVVMIIVMISAVRSISQNEPTYIFNNALGIVPTDSMIGDHDDSLDVNDMYVMHRASIEDVEIGDVVVYRGVVSPENQTQILIVHRIVGQSDEGFITQGDNENEPDQPTHQDYITADNLVGVYSFKITFLKPVAQLVQSNRSFIFLALVVVIAILLVTEIVDIMKTYQKDKKEKLELLHQEELNMMKEKMKQDIIDEINQENNRE